MLPANYPFTAANDGTHTFTVVFKTAGTQAMPAPLRQRTEERITRLRGIIDAHRAGRPRTEAP